jgi:transposase
LWGIAFFFVYAPRRVDCPRCGIKVEQVPWAIGKDRLTTTYEWFLARWAQRLSWQEVADAFSACMGVCKCFTIPLPKRSP